jgi:hypothetical protein
MSIGTDDTLDFRPIIDIENVEVINQRDSTIEQMVAFSECSLTVKNVSFSNIRTESSLGSFYNSYVNIENLSLKDIRDNGHSLLIIDSKGTVSGLTIERDTSRWAIAKIENGSKIDFNNLKMSNSKTSDFSGLFIDDATVTIDTLDINNCNWESHSIRVNKSIFTLSNGNISSIVSEDGNAGIDASESSSVEISKTTIDSSSSGAHAMKFINVDKVSITNSSFNGNHSQYSGGVIFAEEIDSLLIENSSFVADTSGGEGGAIQLSSKNKFVRILKSTFSNNLSNSAGAINSWNTDSLFIDNSTFDGNVSSSSGAVSINADGTISAYFEIKNSDFIDNKAGTLGGAIWIGSSIGQINNVDFIGNKAGGGGAIYGWYTNEVSMKNVTFKNNTANQHEGGAILINGSGEDKVYIDSTTFIANVDSTGPGGAIQLSNIAKASINNSNFKENKAKADGGGINSNDIDSLFIKNSTFDGNESMESSGGAIAFQGENSILYFEIDSTTISNNRAMSDGGGILVYKGSITVSNSTISDDSSKYGGGFTIANGNATLNNVVIKNNTAYEHGGGIDVYNATLNLNNSLLINNISNGGEFVPDPNSVVNINNSTLSGNQDGLNGCNDCGDINFSEGKATIHNTIIWNNSINQETNASVTATYSDIEGGFTGTGNINANPMFCDSWSGSWPQLAGNYHLTFLSPAIGKGENGVNMGAFDVGCDIDTALLWVDEPIDVTPTEYALHDNYPNPFNPTTTLRFDLPEVSDVTLTIYNMLGQRVRTFNMQSTPAGYHSIRWNATNDYGEQVGAGVYLYQLQANQYVKTRKMVLLK